MLSCVADFWSSLKFPEGVMEANPYARHIDGSFYPLHALYNVLLYTAMLVIISYVFKKVGSLYGRLFGYLLACIPWLYPAFGHLDAAIHNIQIDLGMYQPY